MKKVATILLILAFSAGLNAQEKPLAQDTQQMKGNPEKRAEKILKEMTEQLKLDATQVEKLKPIYKENAQAMKLNRQKYKDNPECLRKARFQNRKAMEEKMKTILTNDQMVKFEEIKKQKQEQRKKKMQEKLNSPIDC